MRQLFCVFAAAALALGCGGSSNGGDSDSGGSSSDPFVGTYACTSSFTWTYTTPAKRAPYDGTNAYTNVIVDDGNGTYTGTITNDAGTNCSLEHTFNGDTSTLVSGQMCAFTNVTYAYTSGTATLSGSTITASDTFTFTGTLTGDGGSLTVAGNGTSANTCNKQ